MSVLASLAGGIGRGRGCEGASHPIRDRAGAGDVSFLAAVYIVSSAYR